MQIYLLRSLKISIEFDMSYDFAILHHVRRKIASRHLDAHNNMLWVIIKLDN